MTNIDWPTGFDRTPAADREPNNQYSTSLSKAFDDLETELHRLGANNYRYGFDADRRKTDNRPYARANPDDPGFVLRWQMDGSDYAVACDRYSRLRDNVRTIGLYLKEKRKMEQRPVETGKSEFANARLPSGDAEAADPPAHVVLDVDRDASPAEVESAFRQKVKKAHPDAGGSDEAFKRLKRAKDELLPDENECVTDGGTTEYHVADEDLALEILKQIPNNPSTMPFRHWVTGDLPSEHLGIDDCIEAMLWSDHSVAIGAAEAGEEPGWAYYVDHKADLRAWFPGTEIRGPEEAAEKLADDLDADGIDVMAVLTKNQPDPVRSVGKEIVTDGGVDQKQCPVCETRFDYASPGAPGVGFCKGCDREYWQSGDEWYTVDIEGMAGRVAGGDAEIDVYGIATDGGHLTLVGHCKHDDTDVYAGRGKGGRDMLSGLKPGQRGWLGNPFSLKNHERAESIETFREAFEGKLRRDPHFRAAIADLAGKTLGCWCQHVNDTEPSCHAEVIAEWADRLAAKGDAALDEAQQVETDGGVNVGESE